MTVLNEPTHKRCSRCHATKLLKDFYLRRRALKSGEIRIYAVGECKDCARVIQNKRRDRIIAEQGVEAYREIRNGYNNTPERKIYHREYGRIRRVKEGMTPRGPWRRYAHESGGRTRHFVSVDPFQQWWESLAQQDQQTVRIDESLSRAILRAFEEQKVEIGVVDTVGVRLGNAGLLNELYPLT